MPQFLVHVSVDLGDERNETKQFLAHVSVDWGGDLRKFDYEKKKAAKLIQDNYKIIQNNVKFILSRSLE